MNEFEQTTAIEQTTFVDTAQASKGFPKKVVVCAVAGSLACALAWGGWTMWGSSSADGTSPMGISSANASPKSAGSSARSASDDTIVARIDGQQVTVSEIDGILQQGVDKAIVVDRYINKVVAAERGRKLYENEAKVALRAAERHAHPGRGRRVGAIDRVDDAKLLRVGAPLLVVAVEPVESRADLLHDGGVGQQVAGKRLDRELVEGHVGVKRLDDRVAVGMVGPVAVILVAARIAEPGQVEPFAHGVGRQVECILYGLEGQVESIQ